MRHPFLGPSYECLAPLKQQENHKEGTKRIRLHAWPNIPFLQATTWSSQVQGEICTVFVFEAGPQNVRIHARRMKGNCRQGNRKGKEERCEFSPGQTVVFSKLGPDFPTRREACLAADMWPLPPCKKDMPTGFKTGIELLQYAQCFACHGFV
jgi:hypothetical protein